MSTAAVSDGPIPFYTSASQQVIIPLSALSFDASGNLVVDAAFSEATTWLQYLAAIGVITKGTAPAAAPAMGLRASSPGSWGNHISVKVTYTTPGTTYDLEVTATNSYELTTATLGAVLGTDTPTAGSSPGLVRVKGAVASAPGTLAATALDPVNFDVAVPDQAAGTAFKLEAVHKVAPGETIEVAVTPSEVTPGTSFKLDVSLTLTKTGIVAATTAAAVNAAVGYLITVSNPPSASALGMPREGTLFLSGGVDIATASASLLM